MLSITVSKSSLIKFFNDILISSVNDLCFASSHKSLNASINSCFFCSPVNVEYSLSRNSIVCMVKLNSFAGFKLLEDKC